MKKEDAQSLLRYALNIAGSYLIGKNIFGHAIDSSIWVTITGAITVLSMTLWGILDKTATSDQVQSGLRSFLTAALTIASAWGFNTDQAFVGAASLISTLVPIIQSHTSRVQVKQLAAGQIVPTAKGVNKPADPKIQ